MFALIVQSDDGVRVLLLLLSRLLPLRADGVNEAAAALKLMLRSVASKLLMFAIAAYNFLLVP